MPAVESPQGVPYSELPHFVNKDGLHIYTRCWGPEDGTTPRGLVMVLHGFGEHCGRYDVVAAPLVGSGMMVFAHDHVGHGQSEGTRVDIKDFHIYIRDSLQHLDIMTDKYPGLPVFLIGHSMGGSIAILTALERPEQFAGVVLIAPAVRANPETATPCLVFLAKITAFLFPQLQIDSIKPEYVSRDPKEVELYRTDPLIWHGGLKARFSVQALRGFQEIEERLPEITWPFLVQQGDKDKLVEVAGSRLLAEKAASTDKQYQEYPDHFHALHREPPEYAAVVIRDLTSWIVQRMDQNPAKPEDVHLRE
ncbi:monoglyceride lipase-like [Ptychodera flava]|uniref:monoglyceride lipase-like n=1 Tax=Ptychodera flava TaxID=63121 RepID=UPI00396AABF0